MEQETSLSFNTFVRELTKGIEGCIVAYDNASDHSGCVLYLKQQPCTIFVAADVIVGCKEEAIPELRAKIRSFDSREPHLALVLIDGEIEFRKAKKPASRRSR